MQKKVLIRKRTFTIKGKKDENFINDSLTNLINEEIPEGYALKQIVSCSIEYDEVCSNEWICRIIFVLEKI